MKLPFGTAKPNRLGVALSGGGARGFAHVGALRALRDLGLKPDIIAGVSAGSVAAVFDSAGLIDELPELFKGGKFRDFAEFLVPRNGFCSMRSFGRLIEKTIPYPTLESLPRPTVVCATELDAGMKVAFTEGPIAERVMASCSIPIVFEPVIIDGHRYVDGGVLRNLPAWAIRHRCDVLIGINCSPLDSSERANGIINIAKRSYSLMAKNNVVADLELCDVVVDLMDVADHQAFNLHSLEMLVESGYLTTLRTLKASPLPQF